MRKINALLSIVALSMSATILSACNKKEEPTPVSDDKQVTYAEYMAALEGKSKATVHYERCDFNWALDYYHQGGGVHSLDNIPLRFDDGNLNSPHLRPQEEYVGVNPHTQIVINLITGFATDWTEDDNCEFFINNVDLEHKFKVVKMEALGDDYFSKTVYAYNIEGVVTKIKSNDVHQDPSVTTDFTSFEPEKNITVAWHEKDMIGTHTRVSLETFNSKAKAYELTGHSYNSGLVNGKYRWWNDVVELNDVVIYKDGNEFKGVEYKDQLASIALKASDLSDTVKNFYYYSEVDDTILAVIEYSDGENYFAERRFTWNNVGLVQSIYDETFYIVNFPSPFYELDITITYSEEVVNP